VAYLPLKTTEILTCVTLNYTQQKELVSFCDTVVWNKIVCGIIKHIFDYSDTSCCTMHCASNARAAIEIFPNAHQKKW